jgi:carbonic anhydrase
MPFTRPASLDDAIARLIEGNRRFVEERPLASVPSAQRVELASGQSPFATILGCSDSRVPIETIFDQQPGNLFVVRLAGNIVNDDGLASIEYAITVLNSMLVVVLGHSQCGAVKAALDYVQSPVQLPGHMQRLADAIAPAASATRHWDGEWWNAAVVENVRLQANAVTGRSTIVADAVNARRVRVIGATYDLHTGVVTLLDERKKPVELREGENTRNVTATRSDNF